MLLNCALKLAEEIILYYDARSKKHQNAQYLLTICYTTCLFVINYCSGKFLPQLSAICSELASLSTCAAYVSTSVGEILHVDEIVSPVKMSESCSRNMSEQ